MDLDYFFHEKDFDYIRKFLEKNNHHPVVAFPKRQFFTPDRYQIQSRICIAVNKKNFPNVKLNGGGDLCFPTLNGIDLNPYKLPLAKSPIWNYDMMFKSKRNYCKRTFEIWECMVFIFLVIKVFIFFNIDSEEEAFETWFKWIEEKYKKHVFRLDIDKHPYIKDKLLRIKRKPVWIFCIWLKE